MLIPIVTKIPTMIPSINCPLINLKKILFVLSTYVPIFSHIFSSNIAIVNFLKNLIIEPLCSNMYTETTTDTNTSNIPLATPITLFIYPVILSVLMYCL